MASTASNGQSALVPPKVAAGAAPPQGLLEAAVAATMPRNAAACTEYARFEPWRYNPTLTRLATGEVLIAGGQTQDGDALRDVNIFDPATKTLRTVASMHSERSWHRAALTGDGRVLVSGLGMPVSGGKLSVEVYDVKSDRWTIVGSVDAVTEPIVAALPSGNVLVAGGLLWRSNWSTQAYVFDYKKNTLVQIAPMPEGAVGDHVASLTDGRIGIAQDSSLSTFGDVMCKRCSGIIFKENFGWARGDRRLKAAVDASPLRQAQRGELSLDDGTTLLAGGDDKETSSRIRSCPTKELLRPAQ
ncbi:MAG: kelch repeat-containing protein [Polyangiaceae bacterium]